MLLLMTDDWKSLESDGFVIGDESRTEMMIRGLV